jgi:hypothetical protein
VTLDPAELSDVKARQDYCGCGFGKDVYFGHMRRARERARRRAGGARIPAEAWFPEIEWLSGLGHKKRCIAKGLPLSERRIDEIRQQARKDGGAVVRVVEPAKQLKDLDQDVQSMLEFSGEAFERFHNRFAPYETLPAHARTWVQEFCDHRNLLLNVPPRHIKSYVFSTWVPIWLLCRNRDEMILLISKEGGLARQWINDIAYELEHNQDLVETFGRFAPEQRGDSPWRPAEGTLMVLGRTKRARQAQYSVHARGMNQAILGKEATVVIIDDPTDSKTANSELAHKEEMRKLHEEILSRIEPKTVSDAGGRAVIVGQRVAWRDLYQEIEDQVFLVGPKKGQPLFDVIKHPAISRWPEEDPDNPEPKVLWPEKWPFDELMLQYERVGGHRTFQAFYQQDPLPEGSEVFLQEAWEDCHDKERVSGPDGGVRQDLDEAFLPISRVVSIDPGDTLFNGLVVADVVYNRQQFAAAVLEMKHWRGGIREFKIELRRCIRVYDPDYIVIEEHMGSRWFFQDPMYDEIKQKVRVLAHHTGANKNDDDLGVESLAGDFEFGRIRLPWGDAAGKEMCKILEREANEWPVGKINDVLMALWFIKFNFRKFVPHGAYSGKVAGSLGRVWAHVARRDNTRDAMQRYRRDRDKRRQIAAADKETVNA